MNYTGSTQTVGSYNYYSLGLLGSGVETLQTGTTTIGGNLTVSGTASVIQAAFTNVTVNGNLNVGSGILLYHPSLQYIYGNRDFHH